MRNPYYSGPVTDHFDGLRFTNSGRTSDKSLRTLLRWRMGEKGALWPSSIPAFPADRPPPRSDALRLAFVGHASFLLQAEGLNILVYPVWSERVSPFRRVGPKRINPPGIAFDDLPPIDIVLITHNHYDHMDLDTLRRLQAIHSPRFVAPLGNDTILCRAVEGARTVVGDWGDRVALSDRVSAVLTPANHWSSRGIRDRRMALWSGYVIETPDRRLYHSGDTGYGDGGIFRRIGQEFGGFDLALLPIGAYEPRWFMGDQHVAPDDAVRILGDVRAARALGFHWGTFHLSNEALEQPLADLDAALDAAGIERSRFRAMRPGEHVIL